MYAEAPTRDVWQAVQPTLAPPQILPGEGGPRSDTPSVIEAIGAAVERIINALKGRPSTPPPTQVPPPTRTGGATTKYWLLGLAAIAVVIVVIVALTAAGRKGKKRSERERGAES